MPNLNVGLLSATVAINTANAADGCAVIDSNAACCHATDGIQCTDSTAYSTCNQCESGYELVYYTEPIGGKKNSDGDYCYAAYCRLLEDDGNDDADTTSTRLLVMSDTGISGTVYRHIAFYVDISGADDDDNQDGIYDSDNLPILPKDDNDNFIFKPVCYGDYYYPTNGTAVTCDFNMDLYTDYHDEAGTYTGDFSELVSNCSGCTLCRNGGCAHYEVGVSGYLQKKCYQYQDVIGNYCPLVPSDVYICAAGYYNGNYSGCNACMSLADAGITVVSNPLGVETLSSPSGSTLATDCYANSGDNDTRVTLNDGKGNFHWDNDGYGTCYFSE